MKKAKVKVKRGDTVRILRGRDRGKTGKVLVSFPQDGRVMVEGINMLHRHVKPRRAGEKGQRVQVAAPIRIANVQVVCPQCKKGARLGVVRDASGRHRVCKQCNAQID